MSISNESRSPYNNEIKFCKVYTKAAKQELERIFLRHRISYFVEWGQESIWQKIFPTRDGHIHCTICINKADFAEARELARGIRDVRVRNMVGLEEHDTVKDLKRKKEIKENVEHQRLTQPVIRKTSGGVHMNGETDSRYSSSRNSRTSSGRSTSDRGSVGRGSSGRGASNRGPSGRGSSNRGPSGRGSSNRAPSGRGSSSYARAERRR